MVVASFAGLAAALALGLAVVTVFGVRRIEARFPPVGRFATVAGVKLHYVDLPRGPAAAPSAAGDDASPAIVFIHGASANLNDPLVAFRAALEGRYRLIFVDRPGHGWSERGPSDMAAPARQAEVIAALLDQIGVDRAIVVGHSWGGAVAAAFAVEHPGQTAGLVFVAPATHPWPGGVTWYYTLASMPVLGPLFLRTLALPASQLLVGASMAEVFAPNLAPPDYLDKAAVPLVFRPAEFAANALDVAGLKANVIAMAPRYGAIRAPTVIISGDQDSVVLEKIHSVGLERDIPGARLVLARGVGHMPQHAVTGVVVAAIDEVAAAAAARRVALTAP